MTKKQQKGEDFIISTKQSMFSVAMTCLSGSLLATLLKYLK